MTIFLLSLIVAAFIAYIAACVWAERSQSIDEHTRQHRESDQCPWCAASDPQPDLNRRIRDARRKDQAAFEQALGLRSVDGGRR